MKTIFREIDEHLAQNYPEIFKSLREPANAEVIEKLNNLCPLTEELIELFSWHDGQSGYNSIDPDGSRSLLSIKGSIEAHQFLSNNYRRFRSSCVPIFYNGAGDYLLYETKPPYRGQLISFWHDDDVADVEYTSLKDYLRVILRHSETQSIDRLRADTKVTVYLRKSPPNGLKDLKKIKTTFSLGQGYSELKLGAAKGDYLLCSNIYLYLVESKVESLNREMKQDVLQIRAYKNN